MCYKYCFRKFKQHFSILTLFQFIFGSIQFGIFSFLSAECELQCSDLIFQRSYLKCVLPIVNITSYIKQSMNYIIMNLLIYLFIF